MYKMVVADCQVVVVSGWADLYNDNKSLYDSCNEEFLD